MSLKPQNINGKLTYVEEKHSEAGKKYFVILIERKDTDQNGDEKTLVYKISASGKKFTLEEFEKSKGKIVNTVCYFNCSAYVNKTSNLLDHIWNANLFSFVEFVKEQAPVYENKKETLIYDDDDLPF